MKDISKNWNSAGFASNELFFKPSFNDFRFIGKCVFNIRNGGSLGWQAIIILEVESTASWFHENVIKNVEKQGPRLNPSATPLLIWLQALLLEQYWLSDNDQKDN